MGLETQRKDVIIIPQKTAQCKQILQYLQEEGPLTPLEALEKFGCMRLGARIMDLRKAGFDIETVPVKNNGKRYAKYVLHER